MHRRRLRRAADRQGVNGARVAIAGAHKAQERRGGGRGGGHASRGPGSHAPAATRRAHRDRLVLRRHAAQRRDQRKVRSRAQGAGIPMARWMAFSTSRMRKELIVPAKGPRRRKHLSSAVTCSHFAMEGGARPPSPAGISTWVGAGRRVVDRGTTMTSFARRFRTSMETTRAGRFFRSEGCPGSLTR